MVHCDYECVTYEKVCAMFFAIFTHIYFHIRLTCLYENDIAIIFVVKFYIKIVLSILWYIFHTIYKFVVTMNMLHCKKVNLSMNLLILIDIFL